ncbi:MAG: UDP-N-acetylenolpyruvoylglucosamine reductase [Elusimicrobia bacterium RIFCSPLOWO2_01_FULL_59_12]|nr:MAG: UDP-N-acetylenolpyruvoylglucosamine reductase [Elusimicrobia bacterium RIFCSPLOWO2_01_FULL_59_12]
MISALPDQLRAACKSFKLNEPLSKHASLAIGGPAEFYADVSTPEELIALHEIVKTHRVPVFFLGAGSNVLVSDRGVRGLVIHLQGVFRQAEFNGPVVKAGAGAWMPTLVKQCAEKGLSGIESLIGVPGTIGGGLVMNAGTREGVLGDVVDSVETLDEASRIHAVPKEALGFSYRRSQLEGAWIVSATLRLKAAERSFIMARIDELLRIRAETQPLGTSNCGSVFKNPDGSAAAQWVDKAGFKGVRCGGAQVSERHANFIINTGRATAQDVRQLMQQVQDKVFEKFGVKLEPEIKLVGEW